MQNYSILSVLILMSINTVCHSANYMCYTKVGIAGEGIRDYYRPYHPEEDNPVANILNTDSHYKVYFTGIEIQGENRPQLSIVDKKTGLMTSGVFRIGDRTIDMRASKVMESSVQVTCTLDPC